MGLLPIHSISFHPYRDNIFVTAGQHKFARVWSLSDPGIEKETNDAPDFIAQLGRHRCPINTARFSPFGDMLLTAGDGGELAVWKCPSVDEPPPQDDEFSTNLEDRHGAPPNKENWRCAATATGSKNADFMDAAWSPDERYIIAGSSDASVSIFHLTFSSANNLTIQRIKLFNNIHNKFVQGVATIELYGSFLPLRKTSSPPPTSPTCSPTSSPRTSSANNLVFEHYTSIDSAALYSHPSTDPVLTLDPVPGFPVESKSKLFSSDLVALTFFRRGSWSPDGNLLILPTGQLPPSLVHTSSEDPVPCAFVFCRSCLSRPTCALRIGSSPIVAVSFCPILFEVLPVEEGVFAPKLFNLEYRMVFSIASSRSIAIYDTQHHEPLVLCTNVHPAAITDMSWSIRKSGIIDLLISSRDGFLSHIRFDKGELGEVYQQSKLIDLVESCRRPGDYRALFDGLPITGNKRIVNDISGVIKKKKVED
ncbi:hypothetical protein GEMRC1_013364 [Eukaryota sp. GEM-RC1]